MGFATGLTNNISDCMFAQYDSDFVLLTGATGFVGHRLLAELLRAGQRCAVTVRAPADRSLDALAGLLSDFGLDAADAVARERVLPVECDLRDGLPRLAGVAVRAVIHTAASTRFAADSTGDPAATNVEGTRRLLEWCSASNVEDFHLVSSAYSCGRRSRGEEVPETFADEPPSFHNDYEASKWGAERIARQWAATGTGARTVTVYRPSVVVGEFASGRATKLDAFYIPARATELLARTIADPDDARRWNVPLRIRGRSDDRQDIVPVDYVATMLARLIDVPSSRGRVFHLTHPTPPTNGQIKRALEEHFQLAGGRFVEPAEMDCSTLNEQERLFADVSRSVEHYMVDTPRFSRANTATAEREFGIRCRPYDTDAIRRLLRYAQSVDWADGRRRRARPRLEAAAVRGTPSSRRWSPCAAYFESYLRNHIQRSRVARITGLSITVRFIIEDEPQGEWVCRFVHGRLAQVLRTPASCGVRADFGYRTTMAGFWKSISGRHHPQELFLKGYAHITGDVERALKMAMILNAFAREFPCDEHTLRNQAETVPATTEKSCA